MIGTVTSLILALLFLFSPLASVVMTTWNPMAVVLLVAATLFLVLLPIVQALSWSALQRAEKNLTAHLMEVKRQDRVLKFNTAWLIVFPLLTYALALFGGALEVPTRMRFFAIWIFLFGFSLDLFQQLLRRLTSYINPYAVLEHFSHAAKRSIQNDREFELCAILDALSETALKAIQQSGTTLSLEAINKMQEIYRLFLEASKSVAHPSRDAETEKAGISDKFSYTLFYILQRLEMINSAAAAKKLEPICSSVVTTLGKMTFHSAKFDVSLAPFPVQSLGKCSLLAEQNQMTEVGVKATITLIEVAKTILTEIDVTYLELKDLFTAIVNQIKDIAKAAFKNDKSLSIPLLKQPLLQLRELLTGDKMAVHTDTPIILDAIDRAVSEFDALEMVMKTLPPMPMLAEEPPAQEEPESPGA